MLEHEFFPTPEEVAIKMLSPFFRKWSKYEQVLDPSAGKGNLLDMLLEENFKRHHLYAIEIDPDLRCILNSKNYRVIGTDFLEYDEPMLFNLIVLNPPFSKGIDHVLHAWEVLDGDLVALLNAENLRNPYSEKRKILLHKLGNMIGEVYDESTPLEEFLSELEAAGQIEWLGRCFEDAEVKTNVDVVMIRLHRIRGETNLFEKIDFELDETILGQGNDNNSLAHRDVVKDLVSRYNIVRDAIIARYESQRKMDFYLKDIENTVTESNAYRHYQCLNPETSLNNQLDVLKSRFWNTVFSKTKLADRATEKFRKDFGAFARGQSSITFTERNVKELLSFFCMNIGEMMKNSLIEVFDEATSYHEDNKNYPNQAWKTNKSWKLSKKIIMPIGVVYDKRWNRFDIHRSLQGFLCDMDKILCWILGQNFDYYQSTYEKVDKFISSVNDGKREYIEKFESNFFRIKIFKTGTIHLEFKDPKLLEDFNRIAAEGKSWIGSGK